MSVSSEKLVEELGRVEGRTGVIPPRSGIAFLLPKGRSLKVTDLLGEQVSDLICYNAHAIRECLSSGRTLDYNNKIYLGKGDKFYSNRSNVMFTISEDTVDSHDFLLTPCSRDTFRIIYGHTEPHRGCLGNLTAALEPFGILEDDIPTTFNIFMNVETASNQIKVKPPKSKAGDFLVIQSEMDLIVGLTACSAEQSNNFAFKPIGFEII